MCIGICCSVRRGYEVRSRGGATCCAADHACVHLLGRNRRGQHVKGRTALSVPSSRVDPLQQVLARSRDWFSRSFSTLKPGRTSATPVNKLPKKMQFNFQYPQTGSNLCNHPPPPPYPPPHHFPTPQTPAHPCNPPPTSTT